MPSVRLTCQWWDQPTESGYVRRVRGDVVDVSPEDADRLVRCGSAERVAEAKPRPRKAKAQ